MKRVLLVTFWLALLLPLIAVPALADPTATPVPGPSVLVTPTITIYGRPDRPQVIVLIKPPTAAHEAGAAHEVLRASLLVRAEPATLRPAH